MKSGSKHSSILARLIGDALVVGSLALISFAQLAIIISPAWAQERLKGIVSGPHLKDWRFTLCGERRCVTSVVLCAPLSHRLRQQMRRERTHSAFLGGPSAARCTSVHRMFGYPADIV